MNYVKQADLFAKKYGVTLTVLDSEYKKHFVGDKTPRTVFKLRLSRKGKTYTFEFGQSIAAGGEEPTMYDVLSCLQKYDVGSFRNFCSDFGYNEDSRTAERIYKAVCKEYEAVNRLFSDCIEELAEIQ